MLGSAATFGFVGPNLINVKCSLTDVRSFFMSIGMTIRTDSSPILIEAMQKAQARHGRPVVLPLTRFKKTKAEETQ